MKSQKVMALLLSIALSVSTCTPLGSIAALGAETGAAAQEAAVQEEVSGAAETSETMEESGDTSAAESAVPAAEEAAAPAADQAGEDADESSTVITAPPETADVKTDAQSFAELSPDDDFSNAIEIHPGDVMGVSLTDENDYVLYRFVPEETSRYQPVLSTRLTTAASRHRHLLSRQVLPPLTSARPQR